MGPIEKTYKRSYKLEGLPSYIPFAQTMVDNYIAQFDTLSNQEIRKRLYNNLYQGYNENKPLNTARRIKRAVLENKKEYSNISSREDRETYMDDLFATYLLIPQNERRKMGIRGKNYVEDAIYTPTKSTENTNYKRLVYKNLFGSSNGLNYKDKTRFIMDGFSKNLNIGDTAHTKYTVPGLGRYIIGRGLDSKGEYFSYYDKWDMNPIKVGKTDISLGIGEPFELYDRVYLDDYFNIPKKDRKLPEDTKYGGYLKPIIVRPKKEYGGKLSLQGDY